ncbi:hypothetical protein [Providencia phage PSTCR5]|uniref:Uncharacterized protein n=1 Tax=Providencia phage PSTCR5 TaxID=2783547 RepID=A0A873WHR2_9CAUD|nr:hypothetical protein KNV68_gp072 [Providencia phage PSTCR5]QPB12170.1 hypothetical protein [Providencia phage PSTCR5]
MAFLDFFFTPPKKELYENNIGELKEKVLVRSWTVKYPVYSSLRYSAMDMPNIEWEHRVFTEKESADKYATKIKEAMSLIAPVLKRYVEVKLNNEETYV